MSTERYSSSGTLHTSRESASGATHKSPWPHINQDNQEIVKGYCSCQEVKQTPPVALLHPWIWASQPWKLIHVDFAGPFMGGSYLIVVDVHSKWPEVHHISTTTTTKTKVLRSLCARYGIPE